MSSKITFIIIPQKTSRVFRLQFSENYLKYFKYLGLLLLAVTVYVAAQYVLYVRNIRSYDSLVEKNRLQYITLSHVLESFRDQSKSLNALSMVEEKLAFLLSRTQTSENLNNFQPKEQIPANSGETSIGSSGSNVVMSSIDSASQSNKVAVDLSFQSVLALKGKLLDQNERMRATPFIKPVKVGMLTSPFGLRQDPFTHSMHMHYGIDWAFLPYTPVFATADGVVEKAYLSASYGNVVYIHHGFGFRTIYAHLAKYEVKVGQAIKRGQLVGRMGNTGRSTATHLHYEIQIGDKPVNPAQLILEELPKASTVYSDEY